mgnify:CR=1 FL=1|tara:strand:- start:152 stop:604 length:453 start_codon:yes stop_codon:yes gene_type:complete
MPQDKGDVHIREMVEEDLPSMNRVDRLLLADERAPTWPLSFESYWQVHRPDTRFVTEIGHELAGFVVGTIVEEEHNQSITSLSHMMVDYHRHRWVGWIDMIGVRPEVQHKGVGRALVEAFYAECKRNNAVMRVLLEIVMKDSRISWSQWA